VFFFIGQDSVLIHYKDVKPSSWHHHQQLVQEIKIKKSTTQFLKYHHYTNENLCIIPKEKLFFLSHLRLIFFLNQL
jgi:hypothetical protein